jgi:hypothetical protein
MTDDDRAGLNQTTTSITLDLPASCSVATALADEIERLGKRIARTKDPGHLEALENILRNTRAAQKAFEPVHRAVTFAPLFTPEHAALIAEVLKS